jgi:hyperosmotically inducible protein
MLILRLLFVVVLIAVIAVFAMGYLSNRSDQAISLPDRAQAADSVARARDGAAELGEKAGVAASTVGATLEEAATTTKIKAKMALDDLVKARSIDVTTRGTTVTLSGVVESKAEHDRALALARETDGVTDVVDNMKMLQPVG